MKYSTRMTMMNSVAPDETGSVAQEFGGAKKGKGNYYGLCIRYPGCIVELG